MNRLLFWTYLLALTLCIYLMSLTGCAARHPYCRTDSQRMKFWMDASPAPQTSQWKGRV